MSREVDTPETTDKDCLLVMGKEVDTPETTDKDRMYPIGDG